MLNINLGPDMSSIDDLVEKIEELNLKKKELELKLQMGMPMDFKEETLLERIDGMIDYHEALLEYAVVMEEDE